MKIAIIYLDMPSASQYGIEEQENVEVAQREFDKYWANHPGAKIIKYEVIRENERK